jgi:hypothetical protein
MITSQVKKYLSKVDIFVPCVYRSISEKNISKVIIYTDNQSLCWLQLFPPLKITSQATIVVFVGNPVFRIHW